MWFGQRVQKLEMLDWSPPVATAEVLTAEGRRAWSERQHDSASSPDPSAFFNNIFNILLAGLFASHHVLKQQLI